MIVDTLPDRPPKWALNGTAGHTPELMAQCTLMRNLAGFPFPERCTNEEKQAVQDRISGALEAMNLFSSGRYFHLDELDPVEVRFLAERRLINVEHMLGEGPRGVYVADDQSLSIMVNGANHLTIRVMLPGAQLQEAWTRVNMVDDTLAGSLDFAFDTRFGFLTAGLDCVGSGLKASLLLHLPALALTHQLNPEVARAAREHLSLAGAHPGLLDLAPGRPAQGSRPRAAAIALEKVRDQALYSDTNGGLCGPHTAAAGDLFYLFNHGGLGQPEEEILFQVRHIAAAIVQAEARTRENLLQENRRAVEDRAGRAMGIAMGARLLGFSEALSILSALRLGGAAGLPDSAPAGLLNEIMLSAQAAHLEIMRGVELDALTLNAERADLFRARIGRK